MVFVSIPHAEYGRNDYREDAPHFTPELTSHQILTLLKPRTNSRKIKQESTKGHVIKSEPGSSMNDGLCKEYSKVRLISFDWIYFFFDSVLSWMEIWW